MAPSAYTWKSSGQNTRGPCTISEAPTLCLGDGSSLIDFPLSGPALGQAFALASPLCWSVAVILFRLTGRTVPPLALNLFKNVLALFLFTITMLVLDRAFLRAEATSSDLLLLLASGAIGIGISDTLFFMCLNRVGAGLQAIVNTSYSPIIIVLSVIFLGERLNVAQAGGAALIVGAVLAVTWIRGDRSAAARVPDRLKGVLFGIGATTTQGVSIVMVKPLLEESPVLWVTWWRLLGGLVLGGLILLATAEQRRSVRHLGNPRNWIVMVPGAIMGTYVSLLFWLGGMKYAPASIAAALNQTSSLWTFLLAVLILREPATRRRLFGLALGVIGVMLVSLF